MTYILTGRLVPRFVYQSDTKQRTNGLLMEMINRFLESGDCFGNVVWRALKNILSKFVYCRTRTSYGNFKLQLCTCAQSHSLDTRTKFQLEILIINVISGVVYFCDIILQSSRNVCEKHFCYWKIGLLGSHAGNIIPLRYTRLSALNFPWNIGG